jgi:hypothetical protein
VNQSSPGVVLASGQLNRSGDTLTIELHQPAGSPNAVIVRWPLKPTVCPPTPKALADIASTLVALLATAQTALAQRREVSDPRYGA